MQDWILNVCSTHTIAPHGYDLLRKAHFKNHLELQAHPPGQNACKDLPLFQEKCSSVWITHTHFRGFKLQAQLNLRCIKIFWALVWWLIKEPSVILGFGEKTNQTKLEMKQKNTCTKKKTTQTHHTHTQKQTLGKENKKATKANAEAAESLGRFFRELL